MKRTNIEKWITEGQKIYAALTEERADLEQRLAKIKEQMGAMAPRLPAVSKRLDRSRAATTKAQPARGHREPLPEVERRTSRTGSQGGKLTQERADQIRRLCAAGQRRDAVASVFGVSGTMVNLIVKGKCWAGPEAKKIPGVNRTKKTTDAPHCVGCGSKSVSPGLSPPRCISCARRKGLLPPEKFSAVDSIGNHGGDNFEAAG